MQVMCVRGIVSAHRWFTDKFNNFAWISGDEVVYWNDLTEIGRRRMLRREQSSDMNERI